VRSAVTHSSTSDLPLDAGGIRKWLPGLGSPGAYGFALCCVGLSTLFHWGLDFLLPNGTAPWVTYFPALLFATFWGGFEAGVFALLASLVLGWGLFILPRNSSSVTPADIWITGSYLLSGALTVWGAHCSRRFFDSLSKVTGHLQANEETLRLAMQASGLGIIDYDAVADKVAPNAELYAIGGIAPEGDMGLERSLGFIHPEDRERIEHKVQRALDPRGQGYFNEEFRINRGADGETRWIHMLYQTRFSGLGEERMPIRGNGVVLDITARKNAEVEAVLRRDELSHLSRVATVGALSGGIAHELKQPLASILLNAQAGQAMLAKEELDAGEFGQILADIVRDDYRATEVIDRLRSLLRKEKSQSAAVNLSELIISTIRIVQSELLSKGIKVETGELAKHLPPVSGDPIELQQVLLNLITNAADAMSSTPPPSRKLSLVSRVNQDGYVDISIRDHGPGISPEDLNRMQEPFFTTKKGGLGLGLSICSTILAAHHGRLTLSVAADGGVVATVSLPVAARNSGPSAEKRWS
jgi:two-component system sensor kinase FixL